MTVPVIPDVTLKEETQSFLSSESKKLLINNEWVEAAGGETFTTTNPASGESLIEVALAGKADVDRAVTAARQAFESGPWATMSGADRGNLLWKTAELIEQHADELAELETLDNGKPIRVSRHGDVPFAARHFRYYAGWASKLEGAT